MLPESIDLGDLLADLRLTVGAVAADLLSWVFGRRAVLAAAARTRYRP